MSNKLKYKIVTALLTVLIILLILALNKRTQDMNKSAIALLITSIICILVGVVIYIRN